MESTEEVASGRPSVEADPRPTIEPDQTPPGQPEGGLNAESSPKPATAVPDSTSPGSQPSISGPEPVPSSPSSQPPARGGRIVVGGLGRPDTLDPLSAESEASRALIPLLFDSLLAHDPDSGQLIPHLAEDWTVAGDSRSITFTLQTDARWHDGQPVVADDVIFTFELARDPARDSLYGPALKYVSDISAPGDRTAVISLDEAHCPSLAALGELPIVPRHLLDQTDLAATSFDKVPVGSGPFVFVESTPEGEVHLARNDDYWGGAPYLDAWSYRPFENAGDLQRAVESEQIDVALMPPGYLPSSTDPAGALSVYRYPAPEFLFVAFNNDHPVLGDPKVRLALSMAVDREPVLDQALAGGGDLIAGSLPSAHSAADPDLRPPDYDPEGARQLLAEAGWTDSDGGGWLDRDGERLSLPVRTNGGNQLREDLATLVASYYRAIGVDAPVELVIWGAVVDDLFTHDFDTIVFSWPLSAEPDQSRWWLSTEDEIGSAYNFGSFANESVDRLLQEAVTVPSCDAASRAGLYRQVQDALAQERPYDFLLIPYAALLARPDLRGLGVGTFSGPFDSATDWYIQP